MFWCQPHSYSTALRLEISPKLRGSQTTVESLPTEMGSFLNDIQSLHTRRAKALLQTILNTAHVYRDGRIEPEFRS